ncbi:MULTISPECIES: transposase [Mesorhizobium]|jgi:hypothetical protein|uniref:IS66 family transposase n=1 Tax=Mesorhizobium TaxID=68287 RepID=UPI0007A93954|nr:MULTISPECIES: transposase [Mesorhizobium]RUU24609.1 hypothetical protein EOD10_00865 [Mesorhizobium sp. M7A.T.Ca.TU.009.01.3.2]RUV13527.1 hypothetical protein EOD00_04145 [Mesorhizobium sp. M7A.T.Ca.TU.009.01.3.1]RUZ92743.1 hypothetical protein EN947_00190 [Mesorhizobium sp. M7A.F.Ca.US.003.02.2.1]RVA56832.1 hypothetical protein EN933_05385 [Mesorhizobium sp. M7A.F.Ca.US.001.01.1.1]WIE92754.1 transposase [Mesorhizobium sp. WSM4875]
MTSVAEANEALLHAGKKCSTITALDPGRLEKLGQISQKTKLTAAIPYTLSRWEAPLAHPGRGHIKIDSNVVERSIIRNSFCSSGGGAEHWSVIVSLGDRRDWPDSLKLRPSSQTL